MKQCFLSLFYNSTNSSPEEANTKRKRITAQSAYALSTLPSRCVMNASNASYFRRLRTTYACLTHGTGCSRSCDRRRVLHVNCDISPEEWMCLPAKLHYLHTHIHTPFLVMEGKLRRIYRFEKNPNSCVIRNPNFHGIINPPSQTGSRIRENRRIAVRSTRNPYDQPRNNPNSRPRKTFYTF